MPQRSTGPIGPPAGEDWPDDLWPTDDGAAGQQGDHSAGVEPGAGHTIDAAVTSATRVTGKVAGLGGIKVGDHVSAQLTQDGGRVTAVAIADPAQTPAGGSLP
jgi:hypothetical protein